MKRCDRRFLTVALGVIALAAAPQVMAQNADLMTEMGGPTQVEAGSTNTFTCTYSNDGPSDANEVYINVEIPAGYPNYPHLLTQDEYDFLFDSAMGTDTPLGNDPLLFFEDSSCNGLLFQVQRPDNDNEANGVENLVAGVSSTWSFDLVVPMDPVPEAAFTITDPPQFAGRRIPGKTTYNILIDAASTMRMGVGSSCDGPDTDGDGNGDLPNCVDLTQCLGNPLWMTELFEEELEMTDDGVGAAGDLCEPIDATFTPGKIAVARRGDCYFSDKVLNAQLAGASALMLVNDGRCSTLPGNDTCVINMSDGTGVAPLVTIPFFLIPQAQGEEIITFLEGGGAVTATVGAHPSDTFTMDSYAFHGDASNDPDQTNDDDYYTVTVGGGTTPMPPVADFSFVTDELEVTFTDLSTNNPTSWSWDFGDTTGSSTDQNPVYTYAADGTYSVTLEACNADGCDDVTHDVTVAAGGPQPLDMLAFFAAAAYAAGAEGAFFLTDVDLNNTAPADSMMTARYQFLWLPRGEDNSTPTPSEIFTLGAGMSVRYENVLNTVFGAEPDALGSLAVLTDSEYLIGVSRTYNLPSGKVAGTFGQALPLVPLADMQTTGDTQRIIFLSQNDDIRANVGCVNGTNQPVTIEMDLYDAAGTALETQTMDLDPWSNDQVNRIFRAYAPVNGYVDVSSDTADAAFFCYGSVLDNETSDPTTILPQLPSAAMLNFIPAAALAAGAEGSFFQTDVDLNNAGSAMSTYSFLWLPRGADNSSPTASDSFTLEAGMSARYENVLSEVFGAEPDALGALAVSSDAGNVLVMSRTYNIPTAKIAGTFGQALPGIPLDEMQTTGETQRIIFLSQNDDIRANVGCVNGTNQPVTIDMDLYDAAGNMLETQTMDLDPWSNDQVNRIFRNYAPVDGYVDVSSDTADAAFYCYGSVLDNETSDPTTIAPQ